MKSIKDFALSKKDLVVINPGPGEYVHVMEGQRHGYRNLTIGITYTAPGGAPPMHTHAGEEAPVLLEGKRRRASASSHLVPAASKHCAALSAASTSDGETVGPRTRTSSAG